MIYKILSNSNDLSLETFQSSRDTITIEVLKNEGTQNCISSFRLERGQINNLIDALNFIRFKIEKDCNE